jgi:hypothetical protein
MLFFRALGTKSKKVMKDFAEKQTAEHICPLNLGPRILKIVVFGARRRLLHAHFRLGSYEMNKNLRFSTLKKVMKMKIMKDFAEKQTAEHVTCPLNLEPGILKIVVFGARRRLLHPHFGL